MNPDAWTAIIAAVVALLGGLGGFFARSRLGDVIISGSKREETAVENMANILGAMASSTQDRELRLIGLQEKALDTVGQMSGAIQAFTLVLQAHEHDMLELGERGTDTAAQILITVKETQQEIRDMARELADYVKTYKTGPLG